MNNFLKFGIISSVSIIIHYCCKGTDKNPKVTFNDKPEIIKNNIIKNDIIKNDIKNQIIKNDIIKNHIIEQIEPIKYNILDHYKLLDNNKLIKLDLKEEPQIIDYYNLKSPIKKDDKWEVIN